MDKKQLVGFVLIFLIIMAWSVINQPVTPPEDIESAEQVEKVSSSTLEPTDTPTTTSQPSISTDTTTMSDSERLRLISKYSVLASAAVGQATEYTIENDVLKLVVDSKGGAIKYIELKKYDKVTDNPDGTESKSPVRLMEDVKNQQYYTLLLDGQKVSTKDLFFSANAVSDKSITLTAEGDNGATFSQIYTLSGEYTIDYSIATQGMQSLMSTDADAVTLQIDNYLDKIEKNYTFEKNYSTIYYRPKDKDTDHCSCTGDDTDEVDNRSVEWFSFANQFFNTTFMAKDADFENLIAQTSVLDNSSENLKLAVAKAQLPLQNGRFDMQIYAGPNEYKILKSFDNKLQDVIPFGRSIFGSINRVIIRPFFDWLSTFISSKGIVIIVLIFIIKMLLYPLTYRMLHSQAKMGALKPQLAGLKEKYKDDMQKQQMETMKVYQEYGVSPMGGCMPMILQMPIWYALFRFFPASITFRQEPFLWANDLSSYDAFFHLPFSIPGLGAHLSLFTVLWAISTVAYSYYNMRHMDMSANPAMKYVQYLMPLMFFFFFNNYASGLTCYMLFSNLFNIAQTVGTKQFIFDEQKIMAELNIKKAKPKKKSGFQARLEEAMKQQQKIQEQRKKQK